MTDKNADAQQTGSTAPEKKRKLRFIGSFNHSLDNKGRLVIPQSFREKLGETFCIAPSFDFRSIAVYPTEMWEKRNEAYERLGTLNPALNRYLEQFYALSFDDQSCDAQGRILIPANIRTKILMDHRRQRSCPDRIRGQQQQRLGGFPEGAAGSAGADCQPGSGGTSGNININRKK